MSDVVRKAVAAIEPGADDAESPNGTFRVILSDDTFDRDGESLKSVEWITPLPDHITFDIDHSMNVAGTVGSGAPSIGADGKMYVDGTYSSRPLAQEVRGLVNEGHIRTTSVAFLRRKDAKSGATKRELLNGAFVAVPANPNAVILASKAFDPAHEADEAFSALRSAVAGAKAGARNSTGDASRLQQIHDLAVANGASCEAVDGKSAPAPETEEPDQVDVPAADDVEPDAEPKTAEVEPDAEAVELTDSDEEAPEPDEESEKALNDDDLYIKAFVMGLSV